MARAAARAAAQAVAQHVSGSGSGRHESLLGLRLGKPLSTLALHVCGSLVLLACVVIMADALSLLLSHIHWGTRTAPRHACIGAGGCSCWPVRIASRESRSIDWMSARCRVRVANSHVRVCALVGTRL